MLLRMHNLPAILTPWLPPPPLRPACRRMVALRMQQIGMGRWHSMSNTKRLQGR